MRNKSAARAQTSDEVTMDVNAKVELRMKKRIANCSFFVMLAGTLGLSHPALATQDNIMAPPPVDLVDELGVNGATGQPVQRLTTVSIGGENGLSHHIQVYANHFDAKGSPLAGYIDKFSGNARYVKASSSRSRIRRESNGVLTVEVGTSLVDDGNYLYVMRVFGPVGNQDFILNEDGATFSPIGDMRHSLKHEIRNGRSTLIWRTPEGVESIYWAINGSNSPGPAGVSGKRDLRTIIYPNGLRLEIAEGGVTSNLGFMLKYGLPNQYSGDAWKEYNPSYIAGINLAEQYCSVARTASCGTNGWPIARFDWPVGSPQIFYSHEGKMNLFKVTDHHGGVTEFHYQAQNICLYDVVEVSGQGQLCQQQYPGIEKLSPRLVAVKSASSEVADYRYTYKNDGRLQNVLSSGPRVQTYWNVSSKEGLLSKIEHRGRIQGYGAPWAVEQNGGIMGRGISGGQVETLTYNPGVFHRVSLTKQGEFRYESNSRNFITSHSLGLLKNYSYDSRGNLVRISAPANGDLTLQRAQYPSSCNDTNFRYCNKPLWIEDANGSRTDYTYHAQSGQVETVTKPAVPVGGSNIRPRTTYSYSQMYAYYKKNSNTVERADYPVWKLASEFTCRTSAATASGCAAGELDKVETRYYYGPQNGTPNNLHLRGVSVTAAGDTGALETRVTCYEYDRYGNKTAEIRPKGASSLTSCL